MANRRTPRDRFVTVAPKRTQKALIALRLLGRCGNRATYKYERAEVERIFSALEAEVKTLKARFSSGHYTPFEL